MLTKIHSTAACLTIFFTIYFLFTLSNVDFLIVHFFCQYSHAKGYTYCDFCYMRKKFLMTNSMSLKIERIFLKKWPIELQLIKI